MKITNKGLWLLLSVLLLPACMRAGGKVTSVGATLGSYGFTSGEQINVGSGNSIGAFLRIDNTAPDLIELGAEQILTDISDITLFRGAYQYCFAKNRRGRFRIYAQVGGGLAIETLKTESITSGFAEFGIGTYIDLSKFKLECRLTSIAFTDSDNVQGSNLFTIGVGF